jgi:hypothetical protein
LARCQFRQASVGDFTSRQLLEDESWVTVLL